MNKYLIDSYAWIEYFEGSQRGQKVKDLLENNECFTSSLSIAEVVVKFLKKEKDETGGYLLMNALSKELLVDHEIAFEAGRLYVEKRKKLKDIGIVDTIIIAQARKNSLTVITGDKEHFKDEKNVIFI